MAELERCPICGKAATVIHMVDTYYRTDYGWDAGCAAAKDGDGIHTDLDLVRVVGMPSKDVAVKVWNNKAQKVRAQKELEKAWRDCLRGEVKMATGYIPREAAIEVVINYDFENCPDYMRDFVTKLKNAVCSDIRTDLAAIPSADVVEVVRCRDCIYKDTCEYLCSHCENWFCGDGKRRTDNA